MASEQGKEKAPVPKFSSFKPPAPASTQTPKEPGSRRSHDTEIKARSRDSGSRGRSEDHRREHRHRDGRRKRSPDRRRDRSSERELESKATRAKATPDTQSIQHAEDDTLLYTVDKIGDRNILAYGSLNRYEVPLFHRAGAGRVLGLPPSHRIDRDSEDSKSLVVRPTVGAADSEKSKWKKTWKAAAKETRFQRIRPQPHSSPDLDLQRDFLPLDNQGVNKRRRIQNSTSSSLRYHSGDEEDPDYRSIEGRAKENLGSEAGSESELDSDNEVARRRNAELSNALYGREHDIDAWLQLIDHQEKLVGRVSSDGHRILTAAEKRSVADMKISLYEKALGEIPRDTARDRFLVGMMEEGAKIWDTKTLANKWKDILRLNPGYISLWVKYLDFQQTQFLTFTYEQCKSCFVECLKLNLQDDNTHKKHVINLYVILRLSLFMREAGFTEHAVALWQALLEFNFCRPQSIGDPRSAISSFSEFWESELARIGEVGAKGWDNPDNPPVPPQTDQSFEGGIDRNAIFESWVQLEQTCSNGSRTPARTLDEVREDDPYRVILFSDIAEFCIPFSQHGLSTLLVNAFLLFCHLPPLASQSDADAMSTWTRDPFLCNSLLDQPTGLLSELFFDALRDPNGDRERSALGFTPHNYVITADVLFGDESHWFSALKTWKTTYSHDAAPMPIQWVRQTLRQLADRLHHMDELAEYAISLEFTSSPSEAKKYAKGLLRKRPSSVRLYNAYALVEARGGQLPSAEQVWMTTLAMNQNFGKDSLVNCIALWRSWVWEALENDELRKARRLILSMPTQWLDRDNLLQNLETDVSVNVAESLKTQRFLGDARDHGLSLHKANIFTDATECLALLAYLSHGREIEKSLDIYKTADARLKDQNLNQSIIAELLHQSRARLLYYHARSSRLYKPALTRTELIDSISRFPNNTIFLSIFAWNESRFRIADRVRSVLRQHTLPHSSSSRSTELLQNPSNLIPNLFSTYTELHRGVSAGSTIHAARSAFETAATSDSGKSSAAVWKLYVLFELSFGSKEQMKDVFYRSIQACPWAKELVILAFKENRLRMNMQLHELRKVWNVLVEKELRIHLDLEEWFEEHGEELGGSEAVGEAERRLPDDDSSVDGETHAV